MIRFSLLPVAFALGFPALGSEPGPFTVRSGPAQTALLELFTSEGCSSCPPAEKWLSGFEQRRELWRDVVPVVWHVDYWDSLGWVDRFAFKSNTRRQERYAAAWQSQSIYTPGFVLNGMEWRDWNRPLDYAKAAKSDAGVLELTQSAKETFTLRYTPPQGVHRSLRRDGGMAGQRLGKRRSPRGERWQEAASQFRGPANCIRSTARDQRGSIGLDSPSRSDRTRLETSLGGGLGQLPRSTGSGSGGRRVVSEQMTRS